jgi:hypothetical protein
LISGESTSNDFRQLLLLQEMYFQFLQLVLVLNDYSILPGIFATTAGANYMR